MSVALKTPCPACPILLKEKIKMVGVWVQDLMGKEADDIAQCRFHTHELLTRNGDLHRQHGTEHGHIVARGDSLKLFEATIEIGIALKDVQMRVLRLGIVGVGLREPHVGNGLPLARQGLNIAIVLAVESMLFDAVKEL